ncbi:fluoride efflux transporter CrcB [Hazenella sp. IB182357]|uniref:Fluoride-specific ion channel FluC n=1 Tax=Polycladospora coralii TaxID=2771432 RepID=A0A926N872_9BACL|nr:fluoride efflux transporter CrcB [Polycladospora coralii]MBD1373796.1 fluoride efflux transporter CrcB [Polycladospora coralii]MBS7531552.1 fluoride efflux transporter CrcB [Polycladospora coralii]
MDLLAWLFIALGGGVGACLRFWLSQIFSKAIPPERFPIATLIINTIGSFGFGYSFSHMQNPSFAIIVTTGIMGGFTTFSTFAVENITLLEQKAYLRMISYILLSVGLGISAFLIGVRVH